MRRYTAIKSNVYAPTSTNVIQQQMLHNHMTHHYRMMYNAKSKVDSAPPRHYKSRNFIMPDSSRKKMNKHPVRTNRAKATHRAEMEMQNQTLVERMLNDTKLPPTAYIRECVTHRQCMCNESMKSKLQDPQNCIIDSKEEYQCQNIDIVPTLNISSKKVRQSSQFRGFVNQTWTKKVASGNKWSPSHVKHLDNPQDVVRNTIPRQMSKPRMFHSTQPRRTLFQGDAACVSSGSEGNAGDDEDGVPTSSYDESNPSDNEKHKLPGMNVTTPDSSSLLKKSMKNRLGDVCLCIPTAEEGKKVPASEVSSRDSAYEGEGMSSTEKERTSPDHADDGIFQCVGIHYGNGSKVDNMSYLLQQEEPQYCLKSELYMKFLQDVTDDILVQGLYSDEAMERLFQEHLNNNVYNLDENYLGLMIEKLEEDLGMPAKNLSRKEKLYADEGATKCPDVSGERRSAENIWPHIIPKNFSLKTNVVGNQFSHKTEKGNKVSIVYSPWAKKQFPNGELKNSSPLIDIEPNFSMSKKDILDNLANLGFDKSMAKDIYHSLAGKGSTYPDFTLKELQELLQQ